MTPRNLAAPSIPLGLLCNLAHRPRGIRAVRPFLRRPQDAVQQILGTLVGLAQREFRGGNRVFSHHRVGNRIRGRIQLIQRDVVRHHRVRAEIGLAGEAVAHRRGGCVHLSHRRQAQHQFDGAEQAGLVVVAFDHRVPPRKRADDGLYLRGGIFCKPDTYTGRP